MNKDLVNKIKKYALTTLTALTLTYGVLGQNIGNVQSSKSDLKKGYEYYMSDAKIKFQEAISDKHLDKKEQMDICASYSKAKELKKMYELRTGKHISSGNVDYFNLIDKNVNGFSPFGGYSNLEKKFEEDGYHISVDNVVSIKDSLIDVPLGLLGLVTLIGFGSAAMMAEEERNKQSENRC